MVEKTANAVADEVLEEGAAGTRSTQDGPGPKERFASLTRRDPGSAAADGIWQQPMGAGEEMSRFERPLADLPLVESAGDVHPGLHERRDVTRSHGRLTRHLIESHAGTILALIALVVGPVPAPHAATLTRHMPTSNGRL